MSAQPIEYTDDKFAKVSGFLDGELTQQEAQKVSLLIETDSSYRQLYNELASMRSEIQSLSLQEQELEHLNRLFTEPVAKTSRILGWLLLSVGVVLLVGFTLYKIMFNPDVPMLEKVLVGAMGSGTLLLLFSVLRQRLIIVKTDKYKRVKI